MMRSETKNPARGTSAPKEATGTLSGLHGNRKNVPAAERSGSGPNTTPEERRTLIAQSAYLKAERHGFQSSPEQYWLEAEAEFDSPPVGSGSPDERTGQVGAVEPTLER
jgi:hypothetical protein